MNENSTADIIIEALEVFINHILYVREVYPPQIFRKRKIYNCPVFVSIYPSVTNYITDVLTTARQLITTKQLEKVEIVIYRDDRHIYEKYSFDITGDTVVAAARLGEDEYLLNFEQQLRTSLYSLSERVKALAKLSKEAKFRLQLHTTQVGFVKTCCSPACQEFPWLQVSVTDEKAFKEITILPLSVVDSMGIKINAEV